MVAVEGLYSNNAFILGSRYKLSCDRLKIVTN
jgi:hypothetical protein